jgi:hypothetical protein
MLGCSIYPACAARGSKPLAREKPGNPLKRVRVKAEFAALFRGLGFSVAGRL